MDERYNDKFLSRHLEACSNRILVVLLGNLAVTVYSVTFMVLLFHGNILTAFAYVSKTPPF